MTHANTKVLVAYDSRLGTTAEVAAFIGDVLSQDGASVDVAALSLVDDLNPYDRVVIGSAIRYDRWLPDAIAFVRANRSVLRDMPVAFFFTCLTLATPTPEAERKAERYADQLSRLIPEVPPVSIGRFAGVLDFSRAPWPTRFLLRGISIATGVSEGDYRDWQAIRDWSRGLLPRPH